MRVCLSLALIVKRVSSTPFCVQVRAKDVSVCVFASIPDITTKPWSNYTSHSVPNTRLHIHTHSLTYSHTVRNVAAMVERMKRLSSKEGKKKKMSMGKN